MRRYGSGLNRLDDRSVAPNRPQVVDIRTPDPPQGLGRARCLRGPRCPIPFQNRAVCTDGPHVACTKSKDCKKPASGPRVLYGPSRAIPLQNRSPVSHRPDVVCIRSPHRRKRVALRQRILPTPLVRAALRRKGLSSIRKSAIGKSCIGIPERIQAAIGFLGGWVVDGVPTPQHITRRNQKPPKHQSKSPKDPKKLMSPACLCHPNMVPHSPNKSCSPSIQHPTPHNPRKPPHHPSKVFHASFCDSAGRQAPDSGPCTRSVLFVVLLGWNAVQYGQKGG